MADKVRIGLIGAGRIGKLHGNNLAHEIPEADLCSVADPYMNETSREWAQTLGITEVYTDPAGIINDPEIKAVYICSSTSTHADLIIQAAAAGKDIFCEKPIHYDLKKIHEALAAVDQAGVKLQIGFVRRFDHNHKQVHDVVASGKLGNPCVVKITSRDPSHQSMDYIKTSGGMFIDMTIHDFDMARYLSGSDVTEVMAYGAVLDNPDYAKYNDIDTAVITMKFANGALGVIDNSRSSYYGYDQRTEVQCQKGCIQAANDFENTTMISSAEGVSLSRPTWFFLERYNNAFIAEDKAFVSAVLHNTPTPVNGEDGLKPVEIAIAAEKSLREGRPVKIDEVS